jgi:uncharacterized protein (DUF2342 family)
MSDAKPPAEDDPEEFKKAGATKHPAWERHLDAIGDELLRLTTVCGVNLQDPGVVDRILKNDEKVCGKNNPIGFRKLRELLMATFGSVNKAIDRIGPEQTKEIVDAIKERLDRRRELGGTAQKTSATPRKEPR